jgi:dextranase
LDTIRDFIRAAHEHGMAAMPYLAVYAASLDFWENHPGWRLLDEAGEPLRFEDFLGIMDPSPGSPWVEHLLGECERALDALEFDGLHIDQYGEPRVGFSVEGEAVDLPSAFHDVLVATRDRFPAAALTFNAVRNWPIEALAAAPLDFNYIEIWPSTPTYGNLRRIVLESRLKSADKPVVVALYLRADRESNIRLADALIFASGGCRIELGEGERLLTDPYFPNHQAVSPSLSEILRRYYAFAVRYGEWMGPSALDVHGLGVSVPAGIRSVVRESSGWLLLHLINMRGLGEPRWDEALPAPEPLGDVSVKIATPEPILGVWWASPDGESLALQPTEWSKGEGNLVVEVPQLEYWTMLAVQLEHVE